MIPLPPRVLVIDDLFGREVPGGANRERENLCGKFLLADESQRSSRYTIPNPVARAVFCRGQTPEEARLGTVVENDLNGILRRVREGWTDAFARGDVPWAMVLLDLCFYTGRVTTESYRRSPGMPEGRSEDDDPQSYFGLAVLAELRRQFPELPVVILSSKPRDEVALALSHLNAPFIARDDPRGPELLTEALWKYGLLPDPSGAFVGNSLSVLLALQEARLAAPPGNVLIRGESGTGKELMARYLNQVAKAGPGPRPFVAVNSAVFTPELFAAEMFGIAPKSATGVEGKVGLIASAHGGDLFLDEIGDMPPELQAALLRVLQESEITRVGERTPTRVNVRVLSATNIEIERPDRGFRRELLARLRFGGTICLPALRDRMSDIPLLAEKFVRQAESQRADARRRVITPESLDALRAYPWPGNIRELQTVIFDAVNRSPDAEYLVASHLRLLRDRGDWGSVSGPALSPSCSPPARTGGLAALSLLDSISFDPLTPDDWVGRLVEVQRAQARLTTRLVQAALEATRRRTADNPTGSIQIHPAMKLLTGNRALTGSQAADLVKRLLSPLLEELTGDLRDAYSISVRLRPKSPRSSRRAGDFKT